MSKGLKSLENVKEMTQQLCVKTILKKLWVFYLEENIAHMGALGCQSQKVLENVISPDPFNWLKTEVRCGE